MPLVCTLSFSTVTQYGRGAIHLFRVNFAILSFAIITGLFGLCNIINLSHADLGPPTTNEGIRRARKVTKFWLDTYDIGPAIATLLFSLYAIYRWTTSRMSAPLGVLAKVGLVVWWCVALHVQCRGDDWNVWKEYYGWTMYKTQGENPQRLYTQQVERTRTNQPTHVFMVVGGFITVILLCTQLLLESTLLYLQHPSWSLRLRKVTDSWLEAATENVPLYDDDDDDENRLKTTGSANANANSSSSSLPPNNDTRASLTLYHPPPISNLVHIPRTSTDALSFWTSIRSSSPRASTTTLPLFTETPMRRSLEADPELPGYAVTESSSDSESVEGVRLAQTGHYAPRSSPGSAVSAASSSSCPKSEAATSSTPVEGSLHFSDRLSHLDSLEYTHTHAHATMDIAGSRVAAMSVGDVEALMMRITAEQEVRFQRALEEQARRFEAEIRRNR